MSTTDGQTHSGERQPSEVEYAVRCPDGAIWDDRYQHGEVARRYAIEGDSECGCERTGHLAVERALPEWQPLTEPASVQR